MLNLFGRTGGGWVQLARLVTDNGGCRMAMHHRREKKRMVTGGHAKHSRRGDRRAKGRSIERLFYLTPLSERHTGGSKMRADWY